MGMLAQSICGDGSSQCSCAGRAPCWRASTIFSNPVNPAAASRWPTFVFTDPSWSGRSVDRTGRIDGVEGAHLDRIAQLGTGSVGLDGVDVQRREQRVVECFADHRLLRRAIRHRETAASAVVVGGRSSNHRENPVTVGLGVGERLQQHHHAPLTADVPVGGSAERVTTSGWRQGAELAEEHHRLRLEHQVDAAHDGARAGTGPQALDGECCGDK